MNTTRYPGGEVFYNEALAREAYHAYAETTGWKNYQGFPMPPWEQLTPLIRQAWDVAANAVRERIEGE